MVPDPPEKTVEHKRNHLYFPWVFYSRPTFPLPRPPLSLRVLTHSPTSQKRLRRPDGRAPRQVCLWPFPSPTRIDSPASRLFSVVPREWEVSRPSNYFPHNWLRTLSSCSSSQRSQTGCRYDPLRVPGGEGMGSQARMGSPIAAPTPGRNYRPSRRNYQRDTCFGSENNVGVFAPPRGSRKRGPWTRGGPTDPDATLRVELGDGGVTGLLLGFGHERTRKTEDDGKGGVSGKIKGITSRESVPPPRPPFPSISWALFVIVLDQIGVGTGV